MKTLLTVLFLCLTTFAQSQTTGNCVTCTKPYGVQLAPSGADLGVGWDNNQWKWTTSGECTKGVSILINGVERFATADSLLHGSSASSVVLTNVLVSGQQTCVVVRNYCSNPWKANPTNFTDSDPVCYTPPTQSQSSGTPCKQNGKYVLTKSGQTMLVNKTKCQNFVTQGWVSSCNCQ